MWVRLTKRGYATALKAVANDPEMVAALSADVHEHRARVDVRAPYAAWWYVRQRLHSEVFGPQGGRRHLPSSVFTALRTITSEINAVDAHPALAGRAMLGWVPFYIPAWELTDGTLTPYPPADGAGRFGVLEPCWGIGSNGMNITRWSLRDPDVFVARSPEEAWTVEEGTHVALRRHPGRP